MELDRYCKDPTKIDILAIFDMSPSEKVMALLELLEETLVIVAHEHESRAIVLAEAIHHALRAERERRKGEKP